MSVTVADRKVGPIAFGLMGLTARSNPVSYEEALKVMKAALNNGANLWNAGDFYGPPDANSLQLLNHYFTKYPEDRSKVVLCMKGAFSLHPMGPDNSPQGIRKSLDNCLKVLDDKIFIDIYEPARVDPKVDIETTIAAIAEYVQAGKIGGIGLSECSASTIRRAQAVHPIANVEIEMSLFSTDALTNGVVSICAELGIPLLAYAPLSHGFLTGQLRRYEDIPDDDLRKQLPRFQPAVFDENLKLVDEIKQLAEKKGCTVAQVAIAWVSALNGREGMPVVIPLPGATSVKRVEENLTMVELSGEDLAHIDSALERIPVQGGRWMPGLQESSDM